MFRAERALATIVAVVVALAGPPGVGAGTLVLNRQFIEKQKNRATIDIRFTVYKSHEKPNSIGNDGDDGDLHFAGISPQVGLPMVSEIVNAKQATQQGAVLLVRGEAKKKEADKQALELRGAWRLWFEHPPAGGKEQRQFDQNDPVKPPTNTNPDHMFEIHPVSGVGSLSVLAAFKPVPGFTAYDADTAFSYFDKLRCTVQKNGNAVSIISPKSKYNYVEFVMELMRDPKENTAKDGYLELAIVRTAEGNPASKLNRRMVFVKGTPAAEILKTKKKGDRLRVLGIPRINLEEISTIAAHVNNVGEKAELPYEMIIVAVIAEL